MSNQVPPPPPPPGPDGTDPMYGQYSSGAPMPGSPPGYGYYTNPAERTNGMAIGALVSALVFAPLGIILGHVALAQIRRRGEGGRGLAIAALVIGYLWVAIVVLGIAVIAYVIGVGPRLLASDSTAAETSYRTPTSYRTTSAVPTTAFSTADPTADVIARAVVGDCLHKTEGADLGDGTSATTVNRAQCGTSYATDRVVRKTDNIAACGTFNWVRTTTANRSVVLCIVEE